MPKDFGKAVELYQKAADQGHLDAQVNAERLGKARELYQKAADQGNQSAIGKLNKLSTPTEPKLTNQENAAKQFRDGWRYERGEAITRI